MANTGRIFVTLILTAAIPVAITYLWITQYGGGTQLFGQLSGATQLFLTIMILILSYSVFTAAIEASFIPIAALAAGGFFGGLSAGNSKNGFVGGLIGFILLFVLMAVTYPLPMDTLSDFFRTLMQDSEFYLNIGVLFGLLVIFPAIIGAALGTTKESE